MNPSSQDILAGLDAEQREIVETLRGPVAVLAGAGTGKTRAITHRIAHGVRTGVYAPERVLAVTFTRKAAGELQGRLRALGAEGVRAQTFHGAALAQLSHFWPQLVGGEAPQVISAKVPVLSQAVEAMGLRARGETLRELAAEIEWRKRSMLSIERYADILHTRALPQGHTPESVLEVHRQYATLLHDRRQIDFEDVLILLTGMLETEPLAALSVRERYRFFTVDEYQDVSPLQHALLSLWLGERDDVCVVGDASQTIYTFAGASSRYLLDFRREHPNAQLIRLERNYRSRGDIVHYANTLMRDRPGALKLIAMRETVAAPAPAPAPHDPREAPSAPPKAQRSRATPQKTSSSVCEWFVTERDEAAAVADTISSQIRAGAKASDIAVLYRTHAQSPEIEQALRARGVSTRIAGAQRFFDRADVKKAVMMIRAEAKMRDTRPLFQIVSDVLRASGWTEQPPDAPAARESWEMLGALLTLAEEMPLGTDITAFSEELHTRQLAQHEPTLPAVTLSAVHAAKGLEWPIVFVIGMSEGLFPIVYAQDEASIDEERRLCYVALTRARDTIYLSGSSGSAQELRAPSRFLAEAGIAFAASHSANAV